MNALRTLALLCVFAPMLTHAQEPRHLVLVASVDSEIETLSPADVRRLYLGAPVTVGGLRPQAVRNKTDAMLEEVFLQKVIFLSSRAYDQRLLSRTFRVGAPMPEAYESWPTLLQAIADSRFAVTYMWEENLAGQSRLKKVSELWTGSVE